ncbi:molybdopterin-dependent oxidoreductase [Leifsonia aquatica]|uniref:Oxidoreductase molybdopterin binding domain protein n=2 Tax=Leifsonia aquatica TaxID=144185 RepID=U2RYC7_LEIAQ|nr:molybdopterin-dependent oxidoreductase [Leifsonia aquatica]ERK73509.1 oxidoreductase molybdopterin binding domain protein [Leifsonia aquatica ATCC 14665]MBB2967957.1 thiosulfate reductase cytochrome b subunit [Leifsonia aquatica]
MAASEVPQTSAAEQRREQLAEVSPRFREQLDTRRYDRVGPDWAGGLPAQYGTAPRLKVWPNRWINVLWLLPLVLLAGVVAIAVARGIVTLPAVQDFMRTYPGESKLPADAPVGFPAWLQWQHFLNVLFMIFIVRAGLSILADHPRLYWSRHSVPGREWLRFQRPVPDDPTYTAKGDSLTLPDNVGLPGRRHSIGLARWWHLGVDVLWLANGIVFLVLLFVTGQWMRIVPMSWDVFPNALTTAIRYLSLDWPVENGWVNYNALQLIAYFITVFIAAPLAMLTGLGMSPALSTRMRWISRVFSIQFARSLHFLVLCWYLFFVVIHVSLVLTTGALRNLNHMYAGNDTQSWVGFIVFMVTTALLVVVWVAATPFTYRHPRAVRRFGMALIGPVQRLFEHVDGKPGEYTEKDISPYFWSNGRVPDSDEYRHLQEDGFRDYRLQITGQVAKPASLSLADLRALPHHEQITQHFCIQGWSGVAKWGGVSMSTILDLVEPTPNARWVVFYSFAEGADGGLYYDVQELAQMRYELTMLAYDMNDQTLPFSHGAPLRLRNEVQLGFKMVKWIQAIEFVERFEDVGGGLGGYNNDHEFFGYRQSI